MHTRESAFYQRQFISGLAANVFQGHMQEGKHRIQIIHAMIAYSDKCVFAEIIVP